jgi:glycosyltransferase involved in cell wall biosynthesis
MRVLLVIHGYPRRYNAGSEIYTQTLAHALADACCEVSIFAREEDPFLPDYHLRTESDPLRVDIPVHLVNHARSNARFQNDEIDSVFESVIDSVQPQIVHFGHLNHLSMGLPSVANKHGIPTVFTLHDFWMMCPRGQFLQWGLTSGEPWSLCDGQDDAKCATRCFNRFIEGIEVSSELQHWESWVGNRMQASRDACDSVDLFIAPSRQLMYRHIVEFGISEEKIEYLDYGFDLNRLKNRVRDDCEPFVFGYIGRHHPSKGIHHLIDAFGQIKGDSILRIWGRPQGQLTQSLRRRSEAFEGNQSRIEWLPEYNNENIVSEVFNRCDCIVVPSIWDENSPLVIHEAQQCGVPVITASHGGMGEYVIDGVNGFTFHHRDSESLRIMMQKAIDAPASFSSLGSGGYLFSEDGQIPSKEIHAASIIEIYKNLLNSKVEVKV